MHLNGHTGEEEVICADFFNNSSDSRTEVAGVGMVILVLATHTLPALKSKLASLKRGFVEKNSKIGDRKQNTIVFTELLLKL